MPFKSQRDRDQELLDASHSTHLLLDKINKRQKKERIKRKIKKFLSNFLIFRKKK